MIWGKNERQNFCVKIQKINTLMLIYFGLFRNPCSPFSLLYYRLPNTNLIFAYFRFPLCFPSKTQFIKRRIFSSKIFDRQKIVCKLKKTRKQTGFIGTKTIIMYRPILPNLRREVIVWTSAKHHALCCLDSGVLNILLLFTILSEL